MAPLVHELRRRADVEASLVSTGQHRDMSAQSLASFGLTVDRDLAVMREDQALAPLTGLLIERLSETLQDLKPDAVLAQGDTTTVLAAGLASFYERVLSLRADIDQLVGVLRRLIESPEGSRRLGEAARAWASEQFTEKRFGDEILACLAPLVGATS